MSSFRGYEIIEINGRWFFLKTGKSVKETHLGLPCGYCGKKITKEGYDGCIGALDGVMNACCGHGDEDKAYIQFYDHSTLRGKNAVIFFNDTLKKRPGTI